MPEDLAVVDASLVIKAILPNPETARCLAILEGLHETQLVAPALWIYEVTSTLAKGVHFGQITPQEGRQALDHALALGVQIILPDETQAHLAFDQTLELKRGSAYDSFYLVTAEALQAVFWTADGRLARSLGEKKPPWMHWAGETD